jgi:putative membrane protein
MKKFLPLLGLAAIWTATSCSGPATKDSTAAADSANTAKIDSGASELASSAPDDDSKFAVKAAGGGMAEVELGQLAQQKSTDPKVREFGAMMVTDHSKANKELKALAESKKITLPAILDREEQKIKDELSKKSGKDFDKAYIDEMVKDHQKDVKEFDDARSLVKDPNLLTFIDKTLPVLKKHLQHVEAISKQIN